MINNTQQNYKKYRISGINNNKWKKKYNARNKKLTKAQELEKYLLAQFSIKDLPKYLKIIY